MRRARAFKPRYALLAEPPFSAADPCRRIGRFRDSPARSVRFSSFRDVVSAHSCPAIPARERFRRDRERSDSLDRFCIAEFATFIGGRESGFSRFVFSRWGLRCLSIVKAVCGRSAPPPPRWGPSSGRFISHMAVGLRAREGLLPRDGCGPRFANAAQRFTGPLGRTLYGGLYIGLRRPSECCAAGGGPGLVPCRGAGIEAPDYEAI